MNIKLHHKFFIYVLGYICLMGTYYYQSIQPNYEVSVGVFILIIFVFLSTEVYAPWAEKKDVETMLKGCLEKYPSSKKIDQHTLEMRFKERNLRIEAYSFRGSSSPLIMEVYLDISDYDQAIIDKLKIHFYCSRKAEKDWVGFSVQNNALTLKPIKSLVKASEHTINAIIAETDRYVAKMKDTKK